MSERRYEVIEALGTGGFGTVYRARYLGEGGFSQMVALKVLNPEMAGMDEIASRLRDEARVLGLVRHRAIVQVHRLVQLDDSWTVVMEYVDGCDLAQVLKAGLKVPVGPALEIASEVAAALNVAWTAPGPDGRPLRLLHRDIKPSNIQVTPVGEVKVLDFGIARADFDEREAMTKKLAFGSTEYMAPERLDMLDGPAADVYSLGAVLFEMLTGKAFGRTSAVRERHVPRVDRALSELSDALGHKHTAVIELVGDMLAWDPAHRPAARVVERRALLLRGHMGGEPLRFWAEENLPDVMAMREKIEDGSRTGSILIERDQGTSAERLSHGSWDRVPVAQAPAAAIKRRPTDPTDAPSVALAIGAQPDKPHQLAPVGTPLPPAEDEDEAPFAPAAGATPASPTLVALMDPVTEEVPAGTPNLAAAAAGLPEAPPAATPPEEAPPGDQEEPPEEVDAAGPAVRPDDQDEPPAVVFEDPSLLAADTEEVQIGEMTDEWEPPRQRKGVPAALFVVAGLVLVCGLAGTLASRLGQPEPAADAAPTTEQPQDEFLDALGDAIGQEPPAPQGGSDRQATTSPATRPDAPPTAPAAAGATQDPEPASSEAPAPDQPTSADDDGWAMPERSTGSTGSTSSTSSTGSTSSTPAATAPQAAATPAPETTAPAQPSPARVKVTGDVTSVTLRGSEGTFEISNSLVPPGNYEIWVRFENRADQAAGKSGAITLAAGEKVTLHCDKLFAECRRK